VGSASLAAMKISRQMLDEMIAHAREEAPNECCGMIGGVDGEAVSIHRTRNAEASPFRYSIDAQELIDTYNEIEASGQDLTAIYHSHTGSAAYPSQTDINLAGWPNAVYVIVSLQDADAPEIRGFWIREGKIEETPLDVV
jgi:[CysO sulfur-carrier protein]-S-L-cysteine hydrolase